MVTRSERLAPVLGRNETLSGDGAIACVKGLSMVPAHNSKSAALNPLARIIHEGEA